MKSLVAYFVFTSSCFALTDYELLKAIGSVESGMNRSAIGDGGKAFGAYQMHREAWTDANAKLEAEGGKGFPIREWKTPEVQDRVALAYLRVIRFRLARLGLLHPTPGQVALCWNIGVRGASQRGFKPNNYAVRAENTALVNKSNKCK